MQPLVVQTCLAVIIAALVNLASGEPVQQSVMSLFDPVRVSFNYVNAPQVAAVDDGQTLVAVFEASLTSSEMGSPDQFIALSFSGDAGEHWLEVPIQVKLGQPDRPMWRPVIVAQSLNITTGIVFLYFSQYEPTLESDTPGGDIYQSYALFSLSQGGAQNCTLVSGWTAAVRIWETFGYVSSNPLVTSAIPHDWANTMRLPPSSWVIPITQLPRFGYSSYATLFVVTSNTGQNWTLASSTFSTTNASAAFSNSQLLGSVEAQSDSSSSSGSSSAPSSSSSSTDAEPLVSLSAILLNGPQKEIGTTSSSNNGKTWSPLLVTAASNENSVNAIDFSLPITGAAYYYTSLAILAFFPVSASNASSFLTIKQLGSPNTITQFAATGADVTSVGMSVQAVWQKPRPTVFYLTLTNATQKTIQFGKFYFNEAKKAEEIDAATSIAITFCVIGGVYTAILVAYVLGVLKARRERAEASTLLGSAGQPGSRNSARRSINERTILV